jgi:hypothetical protein
LTSMLFVTCATEGRPEPETPVLMCYTLHMGRLSCFVPSMTLPGAATCDTLLTLA